MHVALVVEEPDSTRGPDIQANNLLKSLDIHANSVDEITAITKRGQSPRYQSTSVSTSDILNADRPSTSLRKLFSCCREADLVHVFAADWRVVAAVLGVSTAPVLVGTSTPFRALPHRISMTLRRPNRVFASIEPFEEAIGEMKYPREKTFFIPNGIDTDVFAPPGRREKDEARRAISNHHGVTLAENVVIWVNHLNDHKRPLLALRAFQSLKSRRNDVSLLVIGDGPQRGIVEKMAEEIPGAHLLGLIDHEQIHEYYRAADLNLVTSKSEGISNVIYEGMSCGLPVVTATSFDQIGDGEHGRYLPPSASPETIARGMSEVLQQREQLSHQAREHVVRNHGTEAFADRYERLYRWCLGRGPRPEYDETWKENAVDRIQRS